VLASSGKEVDEYVGIRNDHRHSFLSFNVSLRKFSASLALKLPSVLIAAFSADSRLARILKYNSIASATTEENPFSLRAAAISSSLARWAGFISMVVRMPVG